MNRDQVKDNSPINSDEISQVTMRALGIRGLVLDLPMLVLSVGIIGLLLWSFSGRVGYPYDLEWMEGGMLLHGLWVSEGQPLYGQPTTDFIPFLYPPLYAWILALGSDVVGLSYGLGRSISLFGTLAASVALIFGLCKERVGWSVALAGAALFLSCYDDVGTFYDLVRNDGLLIGLLAWSLVCARHGRMAMAGILLTLAFLTKHNAAIFGVSILWWAWRTGGWPLARRFVLFSVGPALLSTLVLQWSTDGLFLTYVLGLLAHHPFVWGRLLVTAPIEIFGALVITNIMVLCHTLVRFFGSPPKSSHHQTGETYWFAQACVAIVFSAVMRGHHGGFINVLIPAVWSLAFCGALVVGWCRRRWNTLLTIGCTSLLVASQLWLGRWSLSDVVPSETARQAGAGLIMELEQIDGEILAPQFPYYPVLAGKQPFFHLQAARDINHEGSALLGSLNSISQDVAEHRWEAVLVSDRQGVGFEIPQHYPDAQRLPETASPRPTVGWPVRPRYLLRPEAQ